MQLLITKLQVLFEKQKRLHFDNPKFLTDDEHQTFSSLSKIQFNNLISQISTSDMYKSNNRSIRTVTAVLLCKLRLGLSNCLLSILFQISNKKVVSRALKSAHAMSMDRFVSYHLGLNHITPSEIINQHTSAISRQLMCGDEFSKAIIITDGTYMGYLQNYCTV